MIYCDSSLKEACYVFVGEEPVVTTYDHPVTVNVGEYEAAIIALNVVKDRKYEGLTLYTDSQLMSNQVNGLWTCHSKLLPYCKIMKKLVKETNSTVHWIPREHNLAGIKLEEVKKNRCGT